VKPTSSEIGIEMPMSYCDSAWVTSGARKVPSESPSAAPIGAVMMLLWRIIRRACRRVISIVRSIPSSPVRTNTVSTRVLTIPNKLTTTENANST
jgi:hypothetical protein